MLDNSIEPTEVGKNICTFTIKCDKFLGIFQGGKTNVLSFLPLFGSLARSFRPPLYYS